MGVLRSLDGWSFDRLVLSDPSPVPSSTQVLTIEHHHELKAGEILDLAEKLSRQGARLSVFFRELETQGDDGFRAELGRWKAIESKISMIPPPEDGIWRGVLPDADRGEDSSQLMMAAITRELGLARPPDRYLLDFRVPRDGYQRVQASRILGGDLPRSLIEGKVILIGKTGSEQAMITTPSHRGEEALDPLLFQAAVVESILGERIVQIVPPAIQWMIALTLTAVLGIFAWRRQLENVLGLAMAGVVLTVALAWVVLWGFHWWLPPVRPGLLLGATGIMAAIIRGKLGRKALRRTVRHLAVDVQERAEMGRFLTSESPWEQIDAQLGHAFCFELGFVLRADENSGALEAVTESGTAECAEIFADASLRLDQEPFATALEEKGTQLGENLIILPIRSTVRTYGFWVLRSSERPAIEQAKIYAQRLALMLEQRTQWRARARPHQLGGGDAAALRIQPLHDQLEGSIDLLDRDRSVLAEALDASREAVLVFDAFGNLAHLSRRSLDLLGSAGVEYTSSPPAVLLAELTDADPAMIRRALRFVALERGETTFRASMPQLSGREFFIHVRALAHGTGIGGSDRRHLPGLIILIEDVTQITRAVLLKDEFMERIYFRMNNDFEAILTAATLMNDPRVAAADRGDLVTMISEKIDQSISLMRETRSHLQTEFAPLAVERYPIRFEPIFDAASSALAADLESHEVAIESSISAYLWLVLAAPEPLAELLGAMLLTLVQDSREGSVISVGAAQSESELVVTLENDGFGMPQEKLDHYLRGRAGGHETLEKIGIGMVTVGAWGGALNVHSEVGKGMRLELKLVSVI